MNKAISRLKFVYQYIVSSIGFYPTLIAFFFFCLAMFMLYLERTGLSELLLDTMFSFMIISHGETAALILSSITTGVISLTVFSFTMVMLVLNQAGSNFSPRVIPGLISHKSNQVVMGLYLGTLIYTLVIMVNIRSESYSHTLPGFAIFLSMFFAIVCLGFFVYFIHAISQSIQIGSILQEIYHQTVAQLKDQIERDNKLKTTRALELSDWAELQSPQTGYLQSIDEKALLRVCKKHDVILDFEEPLGAFIVEGVPFARVNKQLSNKDELLEQLLDHVNFYREERPDLNYLFGFKHITESAVKALSPGINDPGTAIKAIEYLTALFALRMRLTDEKIICDADGNARIRFKKETFEMLMLASVNPLRLYGKGDPAIVLQLLNMIKILLYKARKYTNLYSVIIKQAEYIVFDANKEVLNYGDRTLINNAIRQINKAHAIPVPLSELTERAPE